VSGGDDRRNLTERPPPQRIGARGESPPVVISEAQAPPTQLPPQKAVLFDQVSDRLPLAALSQPVRTRRSNWKDETSITRGRL